MVNLLFLAIYDRIEHNLKGVIFMEIMNISKKRFGRLESFSLPNSVYNTEASFYILPEKKKTITELKLLKKFFVTNGPVFSNKLATLNSLSDMKDTLGIEELVFPEKLLSVESELIGFTMPLID